MGTLTNPSSGSGEGTAYQAKSEKGQNSGYVGIGSSGEVAVAGKVGFNGATPVGKASALGSASTGASLSLLDVLTVKAPINDHATKIDAIYDCLKKAGLMA